MKKRHEKGTGFFAEFKKFISKGSVVDLAVGVIIGGAFTAIVTALTTHIFTPFINWIISLIGGGDALKSARTVLSKVEVDTGLLDETGKAIKAIDWESSIYIDWGAFISAIINFFIVAMVLFLIVKAMNKAKETKEKLEAVEKEKYYQKHPEERPVPKAPEAPAPTQEELLTEIRDILKKK